MSRICSILVIVLLCLVLTLGTTLPCLAVTVVPEEDNTEAAVTELFHELASTISASLLEEANGTSVSAYNNSEEQSIEQQLFRSGVTKVTDAELARLLPPNVQLSVTGFKPSNTNTVNWYRYESPHVLRSGKYYDVMSLVAVGIDERSNITQEGEHHFFQNESFPLPSFEEVASVYFQKALGLVPVIQLLPYEFLFPDLSETTVNDCTVIYRGVSTIAFTYVREYGKTNEEDYCLSMHSTSSNISWTTVLAGIDSTGPITKSINKQATADSEYFAHSQDKAIDSYNSNTITNDYLDYSLITCKDDQYKLAILLPKIYGGWWEVK